MKGIVVGIDGSGHSERALEWAAKEAALRQAPLTVMTVHPPVVEYYGVGVREVQLGEELSERLREAACEQTDKVLGRLGGSTPPQVTVTAVAGFPADELLVASVGADLVVVGTRGVGGFADLVMGSISSQVTRYAHCPVAVIPAAGS